MNNIHIRKQQTVIQASGAELNTANVIPFPVKAIPRPRPDMPTTAWHSFSQALRGIIDPLLCLAHHLASSSRHLYKPDGSVSTAMPAARDRGQFASAARGHKGVPSRRRRIA